MYVCPFINMQTPTKAWIHHLIGMCMYWSVGILWLHECVWRQEFVYKRALFFSFYHSDVCSCVYLCMYRQKAGSNMDTCAHISPRVSSHNVPNRLDACDWSMCVRLRCVHDDSCLLFLQAGLDGPDASIRRKVSTSGERDITYSQWKDQMYNRYIEGGGECNGARLPSRVGVEGSKCGV